MRLRSIAAATWLTVLGGLVCLPLAARAAETYQVDGVHSSVVFRAKHMGTSYFYGRFNSISGKVTMDAADPAKSSFDLEIKADSIDTANAGRDKHLKSPDFFNATQFPTITFKSKSAKKLDDKTLEVTGDLTLHGVTNSIAVKVEQTGTGKGPRGGSIAGFETTFTIKRSDYGMKNMLEGIGDEVRVTVSLEAGKP